ncbi:alpha/beta-hydrolase [Xylariaceae sp. FL0804]|nr:alpha/beta-hydrolase [Xylariaceae sp. FL0804]
MPVITEHDASYADGAKTIHYLAAGPVSGPLIIFLHGWPGIGLTWKFQLEAFALLGFRAVAPDMPGWGHSTHRQVTADYSQESLVEGMLALLAALDRPSAVWVAHDWGAAVASSLAAQHPAAVRALVLLCIPYRSVELGLDHVVSLVDRSVYPADEYPFGQWDYMAYYEESFEKCMREAEANVAGLLKLLYHAPPQYDPADAAKPWFTSQIRKNNGLFGGNPAPSAEALPPPLLEGDVFDRLVRETEKTGLWPGSAYYSNHKANAEYNARAPNGGRLGADKPVLFIHARFDFLCSTLTTRLSEPMREACESLTEVTIETGHNSYFEKPEDVNVAITRFILDEVNDCWPGYADSGYHKLGA